MTKENYAPPKQLPKEENSTPLHQLNTHQWFLLLQRQGTIGSQRSILQSGLPVNMKEEQQTVNCLGITTQRQ